MNKTIPSLGSNANEILKSALEFPCAGYLLKFNVISEGEWQFNPLSCKFEKTKQIGKIPVIERTESQSFDGWLLKQISKGFVTIYIQGNSYYKELHRARGVEIPIDN